MLTLIEAAKISRNPLAKGVLTALATTDELLSQLIMVPKIGESFSYARELSLGSVPFFNPAPVVSATLGAPDTLADVTESHATFDQVVVPMRAMGANVDVSNFAEEQQTDPNLQSAVQLEKKLKALGRTIGDKIVTGNYATTYALSQTPAGLAIPGTGAVGPGQDSQRHGMGSLLVADVVASTSCNLYYRAPSDSRYGAAVPVTANGTYTVRSVNPNKWIKVTVTIASLVSGSALEVAVRVTPISATAQEWDGLQKLTPESQTVASSAANGDDLTFEKLDRLIDELVKIRDRRFFVMNAKAKAEFFNLVRSLGGIGIEVTTLPGINGQVPAYRGIPILQSDFIPSNESKGANANLTSIYLLSLAAESGFYMGVGQNAQSVMADIDPRAASIMGVRIRPIGQLEAKEAVRTRVVFYGATALGSELAVARLSEIKTAASLP